MSNLLVQEPKFFSEYINQFMFDIGELSPVHLQSIRVGLMAYYKRIRLVDIEADLNENKIDVMIHFKWWAIFTNKKRLLKKIKNLFDRNLPKPYKIVGVNEKTGEPLIESSAYEVKVGKVSFNRVRWLND